MPFSWKMIFISVLSLGFLYESFRNHCTYFLQLGFKFFPPFILWVMEMNSCGPLKNWETESEVFNQNGASL